MIVYMNDEGYLMEEVDFVPCVECLVGEMKSQKGNWETALTSEFWGEQLLFPPILEKIKIQILSKSSY